MAEKVANVRLKKEPGYLYFIDKEGDIARAKMARGRGKIRNKSSEKVIQIGVKRETGFLYFIDKEGDIARAKMTRGRKVK